MARVWDTAGAEPGTWDVSGTVTVETSTRPSALAVWPQYLGSPAIGPTIYIDNLYSDGCALVEPAVGSSGGGYGYMCEIATRTDSTHYQLTSQVVPGTTETYVDGVFQRTGIAREYTVTPETGELLFNDPISDASSVVRVCYQANGDQRRRTRRRP
jgi:hypothetical protein